MRLSYPPPSLTCHFLFSFVFHFTLFLLFGVSVLSYHRLPSRAIVVLKTIPLAHLDITIGFDGDLSGGLGSGLGGALGVGFGVG